MQGRQHGLQRIELTRFGFRHADQERQRAEPDLGKHQQDQAGADPTEIPPFDRREDRHHRGADN